MLESQTNRNKVLTRGRPLCYRPKKPKKPRQARCRRSTRNAPNTAGRVSALLTRASTLVPRLGRAVDQERNPAGVEDGASNNLLPKDYTRPVVLRLRVCRTWSVDPTLSSPLHLGPSATHPRRIETSIWRICHKLFFVVTSPSHGCKGLLYCTIPNRTPQANSR